MQAAPIPSVAVSIEKVTNKTTGVQVKATGFRLTKQQGKLFGGKTSVSYQLIVCTNKAASLGCRSAEKAREVQDGSDVTFSIKKSYDEILTLRNLLDKKFSGTYFPPFPKNLVQSTSTLIEQRNQARSGMEHINSLFRICCDLKKIVFQEIFLRFFGFKLADLTEEMSSEKNSAADKKEEAQKKRDIFDEDSSDASSDLFEEEKADDDHELFSQRDKTNSSASSFKMFEFDKHEEEKKVEKVKVKQTNVEDVDEDLSGLLSQLKTVKKFDAKSNEKKSLTERKPVSTASAEVEDVSEGIDEENLLEYLNSNAVTEEISLDFD